MIKKKILNAILLSLTFIPNRQNKVEVTALKQKYYLKVEVAVKSTSTFK